YEDLVTGLTLPDRDDRHVLAAAIRCGAGVIVTFNLKDFPDVLLAPFGIEAQHPDEFVENLFHLDPSAVVAAAQRQRQQLKNPVMDIESFLNLLQRQGLSRSVQALASYRAIL
ncbi:MAG: PIN domain-containing protein, partial [Pseudomonas sp.]